MEKETLEESLPSLFFSHTLISISLPTFCLSGRPTYQQLGDLQVRQNTHTSADGRVTEVVACVGPDGRKGGEVERKEVHQELEGTSS